MGEQKGGIGGGRRRGGRGNCNKNVKILINKNSKSS